MLQNSRKILSKKSSKFKNLGNLKQEFQRRIFLSKINKSFKSKTIVKVYKYNKRRRSKITWNYSKEFRTFEGIREVKSREP